jgi:transcriptional regulator with XRE-family HTH domain
MQVYGLNPELWYLSIIIILCFITCFQMSVNERFKNIRAKLKFTQEDFALKLEEKLSSIGDIESGRKLPNSEILEKLHIKYGIDLNWLICGSGKMKLSESGAAQVNEPQTEYGLVWRELAEERKQRIDELKAEIERLNSKQLCTPFEIKQTAKKD